MGGKKKEKSKARLDKFYKIAKEQGYRSRAAFKLIQLNRKYNFLASANSVVDLCAAPGGWLQVATKFMPMSSLKIGVDLAPIKSIPGCKTFVEDITTQKCVNLIKRETNGKRIDVVLHDGAPNVGADWSKDAFMQNELTLSALKLACMVLRKGGIFVTKVFRSSDYNSLIWVFNKFFEKVESTKPQASRTQSAEIFVVCMDFIAPEYTDPKLFDPKYIFKDVESDLMNPQHNKIFESLDALLKKGRNREGYAEDAGMALYKECSFEEFLNAENVITIFANYNKVQWTKEDEEKYLGLVKPAEDFKISFEDLKVCGKRELGALMKWRTKIHREMKKRAKANKPKKDAMEGEEAEGEAEGEEGEEEEVGTDSELDEAIRKQEIKENREKRKEREELIHRIAKQSDPTRAHELYNEDAPDFNALAHGNDFEELGFVDLDEEEDVKKKAEAEAKAKAGNKRVNRTKDLEDNLEFLWETKQAKEKILEEKHKMKKLMRKNGGRMPDQQQPEEEDEMQLENFEDEDDVKIVKQDPAIPDSVLRSKWFDKDIFKNAINNQEASSLPGFVNPLKALKQVMEEEKAESKFPDEFAEGDEDDSDDSEAEVMRAHAKKQAKLKKKKTPLKPETGKGIEIVPRYEFKDYDLDELANTRALAKKMLRQKDRDEIIDESYNRYMKPESDEDLPDWFVEDERRHNFKTIPITKEEYATEMARLKKIDTKAPKKVIEAKIRNKFRLEKKMVKAREKAKHILDQEGISEGIKMRQVQKLYTKERSGLKADKNYKVTRKFNDMDKKRRKVGRMSRTVDSRLKKDKRAEKRIAKRDGTSGKGGRAAVGKKKGGSGGGKGKGRGGKGGDLGGRSKKIKKGGK